MNHNSQRRSWRPDTPPHANPWAEWATHEIEMLNDNIIELEAINRAQNEELNRRALHLEQQVWLRDILVDLRPHAWKFLLFAALLATSWVSTGKLPDPVAIATALKGG